MDRDLRQAATLTRRNRTHSNRVGGTLADKGCKRPQTPMHLILQWLPLDTRGVQHGFLVMCSIPGRLPSKRIDWDRNILLWIGSNNHLITRDSSNVPGHRVIYCWS